MKPLSHYWNILRWSTYAYWRSIEPPWSMQEFRVRRLKGRHKGRRAFIIGNGPSMREEYFDLLKGEVCFGFNSIYRVFENTTWRPDYLLVHDPVLAQNLKNDFVFDPRTTVLAGENIRGVLGDDRSITYYAMPFRIDANEKPTFRTRLTKGVQPGSTIVYIGLQFAWYMGIREFYMLGIDLEYSLKDLETLGQYDRHKVVKGDFSGSYFHKSMEPGEHPSMLPDVDGMKLAMLAARDFIGSKGGRIYNAAPASPMNIFPRASINEVVAVQGAVDPGGR
jgi:hypothetical protein